MRRLDFKPGCPGRKVLEREGIPEASITVIAETFAQEQGECRRGPFEKALRADMAEHGIPDTLVNRERTTAELMRARADMLLASSVRYPEADSLGLVCALLERYPNITEHLEPRPLQLLPWVANRQPAPWTTRTRAKRLEQTRAIRSENARKKRSSG